MELRSTTTVVGTAEHGEATSQLLVEHASQGQSKSASYSFSGWPATCGSSDRTIEDLTDAKWPDDLACPCVRELQGLPAWGGNESPMWAMAHTGPILPLETVGSLPSPLTANNER
ncbi:hypothetical protein CRG98_018050 [Punica granatum]|uniref:Uncharacterized protein n=1 Tax=Punica granatum TaxID=22663 RepID=A0A2I0JYX9_PUNGR|nr:hypothetical protein CRG98_018050 [Punica granatum]